MPQVTLRTTRWLRMHWEKFLDAMVAQGINLNSMFTELFADKTVEYYIPTHASRTVYNVFIAKRGYTVTSVDFVPDVAQGAALTATVTKASGTAAHSAGTTPITAANALNLNGTANTVQTATLSTTPANLVLANGDRIGVVLSGALSTGAGYLQIRMRRT